MYDRTFIKHTNTAILILSVTYHQKELIEVSFIVNISLVRVCCFISKQFKIPVDNKNDFVSIFLQLSNSALWSFWCSPVPWPQLKNRSQVAHNVTGQNPYRFLRICMIHVTANQPTICLSGEFWFPSDLAIILPTVIEYSVENQQTCLHCMQNNVSK